MPALIKDKIRRLYSSGALHITMGTFATKFVAFFGSAFVVRLLSKEDYGLLSYVENIYSYVFLFAGFGLSYALLRYLVIVEDPKKKKSYFHFIIKNSVLRNIIILVLLIFVGRMVRFPDNYSQAKEWIPVIALILPFQDLVNDNLYTLRAYFKNKLYAYLSFFVSATLIFGRIFGAMWGSVGGVLWSRVIINFLVGTIGYYCIKNRMFIKDPVTPLLPSETKSINYYSLQYMITNGLWALFMLNDTFLLGILQNDPVALADYKVAYVLPGNISIFANAVGIFVAPYFTKNEKDVGWVRKNYKNVFIINAAIVGCATLLILLLGRVLITVLFGEQYINVLPLMQILLIAAFINSGLRYTTANILSAMGDAKSNMYVSAGGVLLQIILDIIFIPKFGSVFVPIANCLIYLLMAVCLFVIFYRKHMVCRRLD